VVAEGKTRKTKTGGESEEVKAPPSPVGVGAPTITDEDRDALTTIMQELLLKTHELSFEFSTLDCAEVQTCPLAQKAKELFRVVKELNNRVRKMTAATTRPPYIR